MASDYNVTPQDFRNSCVKVAQAIEQDSCLPSYIVAVSRGGLISSYYLAKLLKVKDVRTICLSSYQNREKGEIEEHFIANLSEGRVLLVDDLVDTGDSMSYAKSRLEEQAKDQNIEIDLYCATSYGKVGGTCIPNYVGKRIDRELWINFFYE